MRLFLAFFCLILTSTAGLAEVTIVRAGVMHQQGVDNPQLIKPRSLPALAKTIQVDEGTDTKPHMHSTENNLTLIVSSPTTRVELYPHYRIFSSGEPSSFRPYPADVTRPAGARYPVQTSGY
jgi:hypothetical protein